MFSSYFGSSEKKSYSQALFHLNEYIDISNVIKRLQDIDKLKQILLTENQRKLFECIPKPAISSDKTKEDFKKRLTLKSLVLDHRPKFKKGTLLPEALIKVDKTNPITNKILEMLDQELKVEMEKCLL